MNLLAFRRRFRTRWMAVPVLLLGLLGATLGTSAQSAKTLTVGVIGQKGSPTMHGIELALSHFGAQGNLIAPDGTAYKLDTLAQDATTADEVAQAIATFKQNNVVAIFGPDDDALALASANAMGTAGVPVFTASQSTALTLGTSVFRTRVRDSRQLDDLADYLVKSLSKGQVSIYQVDSIGAFRAKLFIGSLARLGKESAAPVSPSGGTSAPGAAQSATQAVGTAQANATPAATEPAPPAVASQPASIADSAKALLSTNPDAVVAFAPDDQAAALLQALRSQGYSGTFVFPEAQDRPFIDALPDNAQAGIVGVTNWTYSSQTADSQNFVDSYVATFGTVPDGRSAAAYDAAGALIAAIPKAGVLPAALEKALLAFPKTESIQGHYNPSVGGNDLSADAVVFTTGQFGAPVGNQQYDENGPVNPSNQAITLTPGIPAPTMSPSGVTFTVKDVTVLRTGPATFYRAFDDLKVGDAGMVLGRNVNSTWLFILFKNEKGWAFAGHLLVNGDLHSVQVFAPPPTPTPTQPPFPHLVVVNTVINPAVPKQGQQFTVTISIQNKGVVGAGQFAVATAFLPGNVYRAVIVPGLAAGATTSVNLTASVTGGTGNFTVAIVVDLNNQVNEGPFNGNKKFPFTYKIQ